MINHDGKPITGLGLVDLASRRPAGQCQLASTNDCGGLTALTPATDLPAETPTSTSSLIAASKLPQKPVQRPVGNTARSTSASSSVARVCRSPWTRAPVRCSPLRAAFLNRRRMRDCSAPRARVMRSLSTPTSRGVAGGQEGASRQIVPDRFNQLLLRGIRRSSWPSPRTCMTPPSVVGWMSPMLALIISARPATRSASCGHARPNRCAANTSDEYC